MNPRRPLAEPLPGTSPYEHLLPLVQALIDHGNESSKTGMSGSLFAPSQGGYVAYLVDRIDWAWLQTEFELPPNLHYDPEQDEIFDRTNWVSVLGSQPVW